MNRLLLLLLLLLRVLSVECEGHAPHPDSRYFPEGFSYVQA
jgi:hypothetical protein